MSRCHWINHVMRAPNASALPFDFACHTTIFSSSSPPPLYHSPCPQKLFVIFIHPHCHKINPFPFSTRIPCLVIVPQFLKPKTCRLPKHYHLTPPSLKVSTPHSTHCSWPLASWAWVDYFTPIPHHDAQGGHPLGPNGPHLACPIAASKTIHTTATLSPRAPSSCPTSCVCPFLAFHFAK